MVHMPSNNTYDYWLRGQTDAELGDNHDNRVELSCLMPFGIFISLEVDRDACFHDIKEELFEEATKFPMGWRLQDASAYAISFVNSFALREDVIDESKRLCDVRPFSNVLKLDEKIGDTEEKILNAQISHLIGRAQYEFEALKNSEVNDFRWKMKNLIDDVRKSRLNQDWYERLCWQFPPRVDLSLPHSHNSKLGEGLSLTVKFYDIDFTFRFKVLFSTTPEQLMDIALNKKAMRAPQAKRDPIDNFVFKVVGQEEYLVGSYPLVNFVYIQESLSRDISPTLIVIPIQNIPVTNPCELNFEDERTKRSSVSTLRKKDKTISSWDVNDPFAFQISAICRLNCDSTKTEVYIQAGLFHGGKSLCEAQKTTEKQVSREGSVVWDEDLSFDIKVSDIPRMARLCFVVCEISKSAKGLRSRKPKATTKQDVYINPMGWVNTTVYDFKEQLKTGSMTLYMWKYEEDESEDLLHSLGTVVSNTNTFEQSPALTITFHKYSVDRNVVYPSMSSILELSKENDAAALRSQSSRSSIDHIRALAGRDPLYEMHEQDKKALWALRYEVLRQEPSYLPKVLNCVEWNDHNEVGEAMVLLSKWPLLPPEKALELLDYAYADNTVRSYAVKCLSKVSDDDLLLFLLQLVQALKHECYLHCDLVEFLLRRAFNNQKMGHYLFWHLKSEMHVASVWVRFGLMLEAYCRGSPEHMKSLSRQLEVVLKLKSVSESVRATLRRDKDKARTALVESARDLRLSESIANSLNPLDPTYRAANIKLDKCRVMDSKMRPLWIVLENDDVNGDDIYIIFKNGDDLRQDMLTLQMIRIMDKLWKNEGHDFRMNPYKCLSTDNRVGLIEVVLDAETIANIQKEKGMFSATSPFKKGSILAWLKDHNPSEASLNKAIEEFTYSCAGYCVATYVLGVADRHSDNIMVKKSGQLFHVDFGHILGHFKEKFGFRRERVPFVLTNDFVHVINKGQTKKEALEFQIFQKKCEQAFLILRRHGGLILSLFAMMISTGLQELSSENDLNYLRETLVLYLSEDEALTHFRSKFDEALSNSWKTSLNWASHNMAKNNKQKRTVELDSDDSLSGSTVFEERVSSSAPSPVKPDVT